ncbi:MAG TPA: LLM class flavin-dependent oxidoreductase, partial [Terriglobales bacterium]|nr:LLM class flavin-dependent oxidoreductase [Terriglobales bacterium]
PFHRRGRQADEILRAFKELWTSDKPAMDGEFVRFRDIGFAPKPVQKPHPPIWVGGNSPGAFKRVVTYGDGWHATYLQPPELRASLDKLRAAADAAKRPFESIELSMRCAATKGPIKEWREPVIELLVAYKKIGLTHVMLDVRRDSLTEMLESLDVVANEIRPAVSRA